MSNPEDVEIKINSTEEEDTKKIVDITDEESIDITDEDIEEPKETEETKEPEKSEETEEIKEPEEKDKLYDYEDGFVDLSDEVTGAITDDIQQDKGSEIIELRDASTKVAEVLVPQFGSDDEFLEEGKIDTRRFTNLEPQDVIWCSWFSLVPKKYGGGYSSDFVDEYRNHRYSIGGENKRLSIGITQAVTGGAGKQRKEEKRSLLDRILGRKKEPEFVDVGVV